MIRGLGRAVGVAMALGAGTSRAAPPPDLWTRETALTAPEGRLELSLTRPSRWAFAPGAELSLHPLLEPVFPHATLKLAHGARRVAGHPVFFASRHRLSYPTRFLDVVAREGSLGLLPATSDVPPMIGYDAAFLVSADLGREQRLTWAMELLVAPRLAHGDFALLDFPFLYQRFAQTRAPATANAGLTAQGLLLGPLGYEIELVYFVLPIEEVQNAWAIEQATELVAAGTRFRASLGYRLSRAKLPVGERTHVLPVFDVAMAFMLE